MSRTLYLLVTSEQPDTYLNSILHCLFYENVQKVEFLRIHGFGESPHSSLQDKKSSTVLHYVAMLLESLATDGLYRFSIGKKTGDRVDLRTVYPDRFSSIQELYRLSREFKMQWSHRDISYTDLRQEIASIAALKPPAIVDVSSVKKTFIGDLVAAGLIEGLSSLYTFDLIERPDHDRPWTMLFHDLKQTDSSEAKYRYVNLLDTQVFRECSRSLLVKRPSLRISLALAITFLIVAVVAYFVSGPSSHIIQIMSLIASIGSLLSAFFDFYPLRR